MRQSWVIAVAAGVELVQARDAPQYISEVTTAAHYRALLSPLSGAPPADVLLALWPPGAAPFGAEGEACPKCKDVEVQLDTMGWRVREVGSLHVARAVRGADAALDALLPAKQVIGLNHDLRDPEVHLLLAHAQHRPIDFDEAPWGEALQNSLSVHDFTRFALANKLWSDKEMAKLHASCPECTAGLMELTEHDLADGEWKPPEGVDPADIEAAQARVMADWEKLQERKAAEPAARDEL